MASFWKPEACGQTVLIGQKLVENDKIQMRHFEWFTNNVLQQREPITLCSKVLRCFHKQPLVYKYCQRGEQESFIPDFSKKFGKIKRQWIVKKRSPKAIDRIGCTLDREIIDFDWCSKTFVLYVSAKNHQVKEIFKRVQVLAALLGPLLVFLLLSFLSKISLLT